MKLINRIITTDDLIAELKKYPGKYVCVGELGDDYGRQDQAIIGVQLRSTFMDDDNKYVTLFTKQYDSNGEMKFWR